MTEERIPKVVNAHHFGGIEKLPSNTTYIGRPSPYGNPHSSKAGRWTKEECIALHRIDLYYSLIQDPSSFAILRAQLEGQDLACWCKQPKRTVGCHGDNYLHVLSPRLVERTYTKTIIAYLMEDLRYELDTLHERAMRKVDVGNFLDFYIHDEEIRLEINNVLRLCKENNATNNAVEFLLARLVVDLNLSNQDPNPLMAQYRIKHASWVITYFISGRNDRCWEPSPPEILTKKKQKATV